MRSLILIAPAAGFNHVSDFVPQNLALNMLEKGLRAYKHVPLNPMIATYLGGEILGALSKHCCPSPHQLQTLKEAEFAVALYSAPIQVFTIFPFRGFSGEVQGPGVP